MKRRARWRSRGVSKPRSRRKVWLIGSLVFLILLLQFFGFVENHMKPPIMHLAKIRMKQIGTDAINEAIASQVAQGKNAEQLIDWKMDSSGKVSGFMLNYAEHMKITSDTFKVVQTTLQNKHMLSESIPIGQALGSPLIASFGPNVPIRIEPQGAVKVDLKTREKDAGINMVLVEVYIHVTVEVAVIIPFDMEPEVIDTEIPVSYLMVVGDVPMYYYNSQGQPVGSNGVNAPNIGLPGITDNTASSHTGQNGQGKETPAIPGISTGKPEKPGDKGEKSETSETH
ncbi:sporulation protein YunB [Paenibacillus sp. KQZ6P-2]|uniref:Sporulation protein YunB n=1 Tax=Paenibacillus mangrovi TaxID=2931978 RepID=A0A9X1WS42_9BACL|nr:sporulation protein YunB [Paenibacillus mangrovi]MCJ8014347.1 sporulation protein YunB [Paenibacillus mangrovi]